MSCAISASAAATSKTSCAARVRARPTHDRDGRLAKAGGPLQTMHGREVRPARSEARRRHRNSPCSRRGPAPALAVRPLLLPRCSELGEPPAGCGHAEARNGLHSATRRMRRFLVASAQKMPHGERLKGEIIQAVEWTNPKRPLRPVGWAPVRQRRLAPQSRRTALWKKMG